MKGNLLILLFSAVWGTDENLEKHDIILCPVSVYKQIKTSQDETLFAEQFRKEFLNDDSGTLTVQAGRIKDYISPNGSVFEGEITYMTTIADILLKMSKLRRLFEHLFVPDIPIFIVNCDGTKLIDDHQGKLICHKNVEYRVTGCDICYEPGKILKKLCANNHIFCEDCLDMLVESRPEGISCPTCRTQDMNDGSLCKIASIMKDESFPFHDIIKDNYDDFSSRKYLYSSPLPFAVIYLFLTTLFYGFGLEMMGFVFQKGTLIQCWGCLACLVNKRINKGAIEFLKGFMLYSVLVIITFLSDSAYGIYKFGLLKTIIATILITLLNNVKFMRLPQKVINMIN